MSLARVVVVVSLVGLAGCKKPPPPEPVGGIYAVTGHATVTVPNRKNYKRTAKPGMTVMEHMRIAVAEGVVVIEANDGALYALSRGPHDLSEMKELKRTPSLKRMVFAIGEKAVEKESVTPMVANRYEPYDSGKLAKQGEDDSNFKYFFAPGNGGPEEIEAPAAPPPWMRNDKFIRAMTRKLPPGDGRRKLTEVDGVVVVEFRDRTTAVASSLELPLDLGEVERVSVVDDGSATFELPGGEFELEEGRVAEIQPL